MCDPRLLVVGRQQPRALHGDAVFADPALADHVPQCRGRHTRQHVVLGSGQPGGGVDAVAQVDGQHGRAQRATRQRVQHRHLFEDVLVPARVLADTGRDPLDTVGQATALRVDEASRHAVPRGIVGQLGRGQPGAHSVGQPTIELDQAGPHALGPVGAALVALRVGDLAARRRPGAGDVGLGGDLGVAVGVWVGHVLRATWGGWPAVASTAVRTAAAWPAPRVAGRAASSSAKQCLQGTLRLGQVQRNAGPPRSTATS